jgi:hypothetical protein
MEVAGFTIQGHVRIRLRFVDQAGVENGDRIGNMQLEAARITYESHFLDLLEVVIVNVKVDVQAKRMFT